MLTERELLANLIKNFLRYDEYTIPFFARKVVRALGTYAYLDSVTNEWRTVFADK